MFEPIDSKLGLHVNLFFQCLFGCYKLHLLCGIDLFRNVSFLKGHKLVSEYRIIKV